MAYDEHLADRVRQVLEERHVSTEEKKMMGGLCFMVNGKMCAGIVDDRLMARVDPMVYEQVLQRDGAREMDFTGRPMRGFVFVESDGIDEDEDLFFWIDLCLEFNPRAKSSQKRSKRHPDSA